MSKMKTGVMALGLLVMTGAAAAGVPTIVGDRCSMQHDKNQTMECVITYSDGTQEKYWVKDGMVYWDYPIDSRVPSGGRYPLK